MSFYLLIVCWLQMSIYLSIVCWLQISVDLFIVCWPQMSIYLFLFADYTCLLIYLLFAGYKCPFMSLLFAGNKCPFICLLFAGSKCPFIYLLFSDYTCSFIYYLLATMSIYYLLAIHVNLFIYFLATSVCCFIYCLLSTSVHCFIYCLLHTCVYLFMCCFLAKNVPCHSRSKDGCVRRILISAREQWLRMSFSSPQTMLLLSDWSKDRDCPTPYICGEICDKSTRSFPLRIKESYCGLYVTATMPVPQHINHNIYYQEHQFDSYSEINNRVEINFVHCSKYWFCFMSTVQICSFKYSVFLKILLFNVCSSMIIEAQFHFDILSFRN